MPIPKQNGRSSPKRVAIRRNTMPTTIITPTLKTKTCTSCRQTKPTKQFHRVLTLAQSRAMLQRPQLTRPHTLISSLCKDCQKILKRNKTKKPLTAGEIQKKISTGDMHPIIGEQRIKRKTVQATAKKAIGQKLRWQQERMKRVSEHLEKIRTEVAGFRARYYAYKSHLNNNYTQIISAQHALLEQHRQNYEEAKAVYHDEIKPRIPRPTDPEDMHNAFLKLRLTDYFTPRADAKIELQHTTGMYHSTYDMSDCLVTTKNDKWWRVVQDRGTELLVIEPDATRARPRVLQKSSITGVNKPQGEAQ